MIERSHPALSVGAQCRLLSISRSSFYYAPLGETEMNLTLMRLIDRQFKNIRLLMQAHDSAKFAPQLHKKLALEVKQLELQVEKCDEDQRLEVARQ